MVGSSTWLLVVVLWSPIQIDISVPTKGTHAEKFFVEHECEYAAKQFNKLNKQNGRSELNAFCIQYSDLNVPYPLPLPRQ